MTGDEDEEAALLPEDWRAVTSLAPGAMASNTFFGGRVAVADRAKTEYIFTFQFEEDVDAQLVPSRPVLLAPRRMVGDEPDTAFTFDLRRCDLAWGFKRLYATSPARGAVIEIDTGSVLEVDTTTLPDGIPHIRYLAREIPLPGSGVPTSVTCSPNGNVYVARTGTGPTAEIWEVTFDDADNPTATQIVGGPRGLVDGLAAIARLGFFPPGKFDVPGLEAGGEAVADIVAAWDGDIWVSEPSGHVIRRLQQDTDGAWHLHMVAGGVTGTRDGAGSAAWFQRPAQLEAFNGDLVIADEAGRRLRRLHPEADGTYTVTTLAGNGRQGSDNGPGAEATFQTLVGLGQDSSGGLLVAEEGAFGAALGLRRVLP